MTASAELQIPLEDLHRPGWIPRYVGDRARYATASSVRFIDPCTIVCCSLLGRKMYLIRFDLRGRSFEILDRVDTLFAGKPTETDLCDIDGRGHVVTSNCETASMSLYSLAAGKIRFVRDLATNGGGDFCHGARFCGPSVIVATMLRSSPGAHFFDVRTMTRQLYIKTDRPAKDICFLSDRRAVLVTTSSTATAAPGAPRISENLLVEFDLKRGSYDILKKQTYALGQFDSATAKGNRLFIVDGYRGCILIVDARSLKQVGQIDGYNVPHGVDVNYDMLAIASYGTNSIHVRSIDASYLHGSK